MSGYLTGLCLCMNAVNVWGSLILTKIKQCPSICIVMGNFWGHYKKNRKNASAFKAMSHAPIFLTVFQTGVRTTHSGLVQGL